MIIPKEQMKVFVDEKNQKKEIIKEIMKKTQTQLSINPKERKIMIKGSIE